MSPKSVRCLPSQWRRRCPARARPRAAEGAGAPTVPTATLPRPRQDQMTSQPRPQTTRLRPESGPTSTPQTWHRSSSRRSTTARARRFRWSQRRRRDPRPNCWRVRSFLQHRCRIWVPRHFARLGDLRRLRHRRHGHGRLRRPRRCLWLRRCLLSRPRRRLGCPFCLARSRLSCPCRLAWRCLGHRCPRRRRLRALDRSGRR